MKTEKKNQSAYGLSLQNKKVKWVLPFIFIALTLIGYLILGSLKAKPKALPPEKKTFPIVNVYPVKFYDKPLEIRLTGNISPLYKTEISSEVRGKIIFVSKKLVQGGFFKKGEEMLQIDDRDYKDDLAQSRASLSKVRLEVAREKELARQALEDWQELGQGTPTALALRKPQIEQALSSLAAAESQLEKAERNLAKTKIQAPFDCMVASRPVSVGTFVTAGAPLFEIYSTDTAEIRLAVSHEDSGFLELPGPGMLLDKTRKVEILPHGNGSLLQRTGYISRVEGETDPETRFQHLVIKIDDPYSIQHRLPVLKIGDFVEVKIAGKKIKNSVFIPESALLHNNNIMKVDDNSKISFVKIKVLKRVRDRVLVSGNLEENDKIVVSRLEFPVEGAIVRINGKDSEDK